MKDLEKLTIEKLENYLNSVLDNLEELSNERALKVKQLFNLGFYDLIYVCSPKEAKEFGFVSRSLNEHPKFFDKFKEYTASIKVIKSTKKNSTSKYIDKSSGLLEYSLVLTSLSDDFNGNGKFDDTFFDEGFKIGNIVDLIYQKLEEFVSKPRKVKEIFAEKLLTCLDVFKNGEYVKSIWYLEEEYEDFVVEVFDYFVNEDFTPNELTVSLNGIIVE